jgi:hypothetical protein
MTLPVGRKVDGFVSGFDYCSLDRLLKPAEASPLLVTSYSFA